MNIQLKPNQEKFIEEQLKSGRFDHVEQLIDTALHLLDTINEDYLQWREETGHQIDIAVAELDNGEGLEVETVINNILEKFQKERQSYSGKRLSEIQTKLCLAWFIACDTVPNTTAHRYKLVRYTYFSSLLTFAFCLLPKTHNFCTSAD